MRLPEMPYTPSLKKSVQTQFGGYNHNIGAGDGEIFDMLNLTSDYYPVLSTRGKRYDAGAVNADNGIIYVDDEQYRAHGTNLFHNNILIGTVADSEKTFAVLPYYLVMYPDKKVIRLRVKGYYSSLSALAAAVTTPETNDIYGVGSAGSYASYYYTGTEWQKSGQVVENIETSWTGGVTFIADGEYAGVPADNNTIYNAAVDWSDYFRVGDAVEISGCINHKENNIKAVIREIENGFLRFYENTFTLDDAYTYELTEPLYIGTDAVPVKFQFSVGDLFIEIDGANLKTYADIKDNEYYLPMGSNFKYGWGIADGVYYNFEGSLGPRSVNVNASIYHYLPVTEDKTETATYAAKKYHCTWSGENCYFEVGAGTAPTLYEGYFEFSRVFNTTFATVLTFHYGEEETLDISLHDAAPDTCGTKLNIRTESKNYDEASITIRRKAPDLNYIAGHNNRIWGCKEDKIYASKLGDPFNFNVFDGLSTDSYAVETGTAGDFTGVFSYLGYPLFFKEDVIFKVYGNYPSEFQVVPSARNGVKAGSDRSLAVAGEVLYYHNKAGIMAYTGGTPALVSSALGDALYHDAIAGSNGEKYFVDMQDAANVHHLFVYDAKGLWMKEETDGMQSFVNHSGELWAYNGHLVAMSAKSAPTGTTAETSVEWMMETADITANSPNKKGISGFQIRCEITGSMTVSLQCDGGEWAEKGSYTTEGKRTFLIPIIPQRADCYRLKMQGTGTFKLFGLAIQTYDGSEI